MFQSRAEMTKIVQLNSESFREKKRCRRASEWLIPGSMEGFTLLKGTVTLKTFPGLTFKDKNVLLNSNPPLKMPTHLHVKI